MRLKFFASINCVSLWKQNEFESNLFQGVCEAVIGPTFLDLRDLYQTSINTISFIVLFRAVGSLIGTFLGRKHQKKPQFIVKYIWAVLMCTSNQKKPREHQPWSEGKYFCIDVLILILISGKKFLLGLLINSAFFKIS